MNGVSIPKASLLKYLVINLVFSQHKVYSYMQYDVN